MEIGDVAVIVDCFRQVGPRSAGMHGWCRGSEGCVALLRGSAISGENARMMDATDQAPLSGLELIVLARLSSKPPKQKDLNDAVANFAPPDGLDRPVEVVVEDALEVLRRRGLVAPG